jgi:hypothetical protein
MRKSGMFLLFVLTVGLTFGYLGAAENWVWFGRASSERSPAVEVLSSSNSDLVLRIAFPGMEVRDMEKAGEIYQAMNVPGGGRTHNLGWPELPTWSRFIAVPQGAIPQVEIVHYTEQTLTGYNVFPAQELPVDEAGAPEPEFTKDEQFYSRDEFYPDRLAFASDPKVIRGCQVSSLTLYPLRYNPSRGELKVVSEMEVRVSFIGGNGAFVDPRLRSPYFESLFANLLLNYSAVYRTQHNSAPGEFPQANPKGENGCDFLIITHPDFQAWAESLAFWKNLSGIPTWVRSTTQTGSDTGSIRAYLQNAYNTWDPPPSFLLLMGDAEYVPLFYRSTHPYDYLKTGTDLYYTTLDGYDYFPDLFPGRISVDNASQAATVIGKILQYERSPISSPATFYDNALAAGYFQDTDYDGYADRFFLQTSEVLRDFLIGSQGKSVERCYTTTPGSNPYCYYYGQPLPLGLVWTGSAVQINNAIDNGVFLVTHRDHGGVAGWGDPAYDTSDVRLLANGDKLPVVLSINCETGHFDNETDAAGHGTPYSAVCFCETFSRIADGGAVGVLGHTRVSWSGLNDELAKGLYDAIWPDFDPSYPGTGSTHPVGSPMYRMGTMLNFGKFWMYDKYHLTGGQGYPWGSDNQSTKITFEMGTWFGDPTMQIWTELPQDLNVSHSDTVTVGRDSCAVLVTSEGSPVESAWVCLMKDEVYQTGSTDVSGQLVLACSTTVEGEMQLTVTKHNFRPYQGLVSVIMPGYLRGDANGDEQIDVADVVFLANYLFKGEAPPFPYDAGEVTCDGFVDIADAIFLLNYLFKNGPVPDCG